MKAVYQKPMTEVITYKSEHLIMASPNNIDHADSKIGFFDEEDDDLTNNDLWDKDDLWK